MKLNQLKMGAVLSYGQMTLNVLIGLIYTPVMLKLLGKSEYGLYNTVSSTISMLSIMSLGFQSSYIRFFAEYKAKGEREKIHTLNGVFLMVFSAIGILALLCGLYLSFHLEYVFDQGLTPSEYRTARVLMLMLTVNLAISFPMSTFTSIISAHERYVFLKLMGMMKTVLSPMLTLPLLLMGYQSIALVAVTVAVSVLTDLCYLFYSRKKLGVRFVFSGMERRLARSLFSYSIFIAIHIIVDQINNNMDKFLLGRFVGTEEVAVYAVGYTIYHYYMAFSVGISAVFSPRIHKIVNSTLDDRPEQKKQLTDLFLRIGRIQFLLLALIVSGFVFFGQEFLHFWAGEGYENSYYVAVLLMIPATVPFIQNAGIEIQRALNRHQVANLCYLGMAILNLVISIELCQRYGAVGSATGTAISFVLANGIMINIYYHKRCNLDIVKFWKSIGRLVLGLVFPVTAGCIMKYFVDFHRISFLLAGILGYTGIYCVSMWLIGMNAYEKDLVRGVLGRLRRSKQ